MSLIIPSIGAFGYAPAAGGGLSVVAVSGGNEVTIGAGTENVTIPGTPATGDRVVVIRACDITLAGANSTGYTDVIDDGGGATPGFCIEEKTMGGTPDSVAAVPQTSSRQSVIVALLRGVNATFLDQTIPAVWSGTSSSAFPPAIDTQTNGALVMVVGALDDDDSDATAFPSGYTNTAMAKTSAADSTNGASVAVAFKTIATAGTETPGSFTFESSDTAKGITIAIKPA